MIDQSSYQELDLLLDDINAEYRWRQMSDYGRKELASFAPKRRWSNRDIRDVRAAIDCLPAVMAKRRDISAGSEVPLGDLRRYYANITFERPNGWDDMRFANVGMHGAASSLVNYMRRVDTVETARCSAVYVASHAAAASGIATTEYVQSDREGHRFGTTSSQIHIGMSRAAFACIRPLLQDARRRHASRPEVVVILSADVDRGLNLRTRQLEAGLGQTFPAVTSGPFQPVRWHVHLFEPPAWPVPDWKTKVTWLPNDYALDHAVKSWVIEEFAGPSRDGLFRRASSRMKAFRTQLDRPSL